MNRKFFKNYLTDIFLLSLFSILINFKYGSLGVLPQDTFAYFDTGYRVSQGSIPFIDYWTVSGPFIDFFQAGLFYIFGVSWKSYILSGCLINFFITVLFYLTLKEFKLNRVINVFYSACFAILANPSMGTPFPDHFSSFLSLAGILIFFILIKKKESYYWLVIPFLFFISFFSKQTPAAYLFIGFILMISIYYFLFKKMFFLKYFFVSSLFCFVSFYIFLSTYDINFELFLDQYIFYPQTIGSFRLEKYDINLNFLNQFKFILLANLFVVFNIIYLIKEKKIKKEKEKILINFSLFILTFSFVFHQILTMNFIFIFFLIPFICAFMHINFLSFKKYYKLVSIFLISLTLFTTIKYHLRFNEDRKMLNLEKVNLDRAVESSLIDKKLSGLKWITRTYNQKPEKEVKILSILKKELLKEKKNLMLYSDYIFLSAILEKDLNTPTRWPSLDDASNPSKDNQFHQKYLDYVKNLVIKKNIDVIYSTVDKKYDIFYIIFDENCRKIEEINEVLIKHDIKNCKKT